MAAFIEILVYSLFFSLVTSAIYRVFIKPGEARRLKEEAKSYKDKYNKAKASGDKVEMEKFMKETLRASQAQLRKSTKPMLFSMLIFFVFIGWVASAYVDATIALPVPLPASSWNFPFIHLTREYSWFWWYLIITIPATLFFRKMLGVD